MTNQLAKAMLMPAVYQLVPGSMIARMWFETIIPPADASQQERISAGRGDWI